MNNGTSFDTVNSNNRIASEREQHASRGNSRLTRPAGHDARERSYVREGCLRDMICFIRDVCEQSVRTHVCAHAFYLFRSIRRPRFDVRNVSDEPARRAIVSRRVFRRRRSAKRLDQCFPDFFHSTPLLMFENLTPPP